MPPGPNDRLDQPGIYSRGRVHLQVVRPEGVNAVDQHVRAPLADPPVAACSFATVDLVEVAMHAYQIHVQAFKKRSKLAAPGRELDDVIQDQIVTSVRKRGQAAVEAGEEPRPHLVPPVERTALLAPSREHSGSYQMVRRDMQEWLVQHVLQAPGQRRLA
jgi:hypothetical protein